MGRNKYAAQAKEARRRDKKERAAARKAKACERKKAYDTEEEAYQKNQKTYKCKHCGKWHRSGALLTTVNRIAKKHIMPDELEHRQRKNR